MDNVTREASTLTTDPAIGTVLPGADDKSTLIDDLRERDKPLLATKPAYGPG
jgi:hypothetical protein